MHLYLRTTQGECFYAKNIEEALEQFLSEEGYRLSLMVDGKDITLRKAAIAVPRGGILDEHKFEALVTIR